MLTLKLITEEKERVIKGLEKKCFKTAAEAVEKAIQLDKTRREAQTQLDATLAESKKMAAVIGKLMKEGKTFEQSLRTREFEPDGPNYTPRISGIMNIENGHFNFAMSILKSSNGDPSGCNRYTFAYENPKAGEGRFIHTYMEDGNPLPSFEGEPTWVNIDDLPIDDFANLVWENLNEDNKVSLFVRYIDIETGKYESRIINKNK